MDKDKTLKDDETPALISADKVSGTAVHTPAGEKLGTIENIMIDKVSGQVEYAVLAFWRPPRHGKGPASPTLGRAHVRYQSKCLRGRPRSTVS